MSTTIKNMAGDREVRIAPVRDFGGAMVEIGNYILGVYRADAWLPRADFLAAIEAELDVIIIEKADLPEVILDADVSGHVAAGPYAGNPRRDGVDHRVWAMAHLALAEHLAAHLPVDEAQVEALADLLEQEDRGARPLNEDLARRLLATGRIEVRDV